LFGVLKLGAGAELCVSGCELRWLSWIDLGVSAGVRFPVFSESDPGQIFHETHAQVGDMYVMLESDTGSTLATIKSTQTGRFTFLG